MSIHILLGKPGSGKSLYATNRVLTELRETNRNIVTNLPLRLDSLNEYVQKRWPSDDLRPMQRIRLLTDDEMRTFWEIRGEGDVKTGVAYFLDEAHIAFNAREWATLGKGALHYLSQHRKLGDIVWVITQAPGNLDKQFRSVAEDFTVLRNEYTAKWGPFRGRGRFVRKSYLSEPQSNSEPFETASFTLDGVKECYDTARGIGVHGSKADIGRRAKGVPIIWVVPGALALALSCAAVPWAIGKGVGSWLGGDAEKAKVAGAEPVVQAKPVAKSTPAQTAAPQVVQADYYATERAVWVTGTVVRGRQINVSLSDGRTLTEADDLHRVERNFAELKDGTRYYMKKPDVRPFRVEVPKAVERAEPPAEKVSEYKGEALFAPSSSVAALPSPTLPGTSSGRRNQGRQ